MKIQHKMKAIRIIKTTAILAIALTGCTLLTGCKTTEANYKAAYELAKNKGTSEGVDADVYEAIEKEKQPQTRMVDGDSIPMRREYVSVATGDKVPAGRKLEYNVAVGQFKQIFNARMMCQRLIGMGYQEACVLKTAGQEYIVIAASTDDRDALKSIYEKVKGEKGLSLKPPYPYVLTPTNK